MSSVVLIRSNIFKSNVSGIIGIACIRANNYSTDVNVYNLASLKKGTGGRSSFNGVVATVFGATGFYGRYVCNRLGKIGTQLIIPYRGDTYDPFKLKLSGDLGQVYFHHYNLNDEDSILKCMKYSNVVINLVGRDWETRNFSFDDVHVDGARRLAKLAKKSGIERFIHLSSLNASEIPNTSGILKGGSEFLRSKARGEIAVMEEFPEATIIRPADTYGFEDRFLRYYVGSIRRNGAWIPLWHKGEKTEKQPVYVGDVAHGIVNAMKDPDTAGKIYQAVGPKRYQLSELVDYFFRVMRRDVEWGYRRYDMRYDPLFQLKVTLTSKLAITYPMGAVTWDKIEREHLSDDIKAGMPTLEDLGVNLTPVEEMMPFLLKQWTFGIYRGLDPDEPQEPAAPPKTVMSQLHA